MYYRVREHKPWGVARYGDVIRFIESLFFVLVSRTSLHQGGTMDPWCTSRFRHVPCAMNDDDDAQVVCGARPYLGDRRCVDQ